MEDSSNTSESKNRFRFSPSVPFLCIAIVLAGIGTIKAIQSVVTDQKGEKSLYFFGAAALLLVIDRVNHAEFSKDGVKVDLAAVQEAVQKTLSSEVNPKLKEIGNMAASAREDVHRALSGEVNQKLDDSSSSVAASPREIPDVPAFVVASATPPLDEGISTKPPAASPETTSPASSSVVGAHTTASPSAWRAITESSALPPPTVADDPQKGRFGGKAWNGGRCLTATLDKAPPNARYYKVNLEVSRVNQSSPPLEGVVVFYLHNTFSPSVREVRVSDGVARLALMSYGAFTVGAVADGGATLLELDLSQDTRFPENFRNS